MMLMGWTSPSPERPSSYGTPAAAATTPLPVASITTFALNVRSPSAHWTRTPVTRLPSITGPSTSAWSSTSAPASFRRSYARTSARWKSTLCSKPIRFAMSFATGLTVQNENGLTRADTPMPPRRPLFSRTSVLAPRAAATYPAPMPAGPPPATITS